jgi:hypothetical protein
VPDSDEAEVTVCEVNNGEAKDDFYQNNDIRKAVQLIRHADMLKNWMIDERKAAKSGWKILPSVTLANRIMILQSWANGSASPCQAQSRILSRAVCHVCRLLPHFQNEMKAIGDDTLGQEELILRKLGATKERIQEKRIQICDAVAGKSSAIQTVL